MKRSFNGLKILNKVSIVRADLGYHVSYIANQCNIPLATTIVSL